MPLDLPRSPTAWLGAGTHVGSRVLGLLLSIVLARSLGAADYGVYAYAFAWLGFLLVFAQVGVPTFALREVTDARHHERWGLVRGILRESQRLVLLASIVVSVAGFSVLFLFFDDLPQGRFWTTFWMLVCVPFAALIGVLAASLRGLGLPTFGLVLQLLIQPALVLLLVLIVLFEAVELLGPTTMLQLQLIGAVSVCAIGLICLRLRSSGSGGSQETTPVAWRDWMPSLLPLTVISGATLINSQADIVILGFFAPTSDIGVYRVAVQVALITGFASHVAASLLAPAVAQYWATRNVTALRRLMSRATRFIALLTFAAVATLGLIGEALVGYIFGAPYTGAYEPLVWLMVGQLVGAIAGPMGVVLNMCGYERRNSQLLMLSCALNIVMNLVLIPLYGLAGAAAATSIALSFRSAVQWWYTRRLVWSGSDT